MAERRVVPAGRGISLRLKRGQHLRIIDTEGGQSGDLMVFSDAGDERLSNGRTFDYGGKIYVSTGDVLYSDRSNPMMTIVADDVGRHDMLYAPCSVEMYQKQYGVQGYHPNCNDNLSQGLRDLGLEPGVLPNALNFFLHVTVLHTGKLVIAPPRSQAGDSLLLRAEMDLAVAVTACPSTGCNGGAPPRPLAVEVSH
jgi:uncharacterized protein